MKRFGIHTIANITAITITSLLLTGFVVTGGVLAYLFLAAALAGVSLLTRPVIRFLTLPVNFPLLLLFNLVLDFAALYIFRIIVPGYKIAAGQFLGIKTSIFVIPSWRVEAVITVLIAAIVFALMSVLVEFLLSTPSSDSI